MSAKLAEKPETDAKVKKKKGEEKELSKDEALAGFFEAVNDKYGKGTAALVTEMVSVDIPRLPTGVFALDLAMGGGVPMGRVTMCFGPKSSGKTSIAMRAVAHAQRICSRCHQPAEWKVIENTDPKTGELKVKHVGSCPSCKEKFQKTKCVWIDVEGAFDRGWAIAMGVWVEELFIIRPETAEQTVDIVDNLLRTKACDVLALDSIAALVPTAEIEESSAKWQQGLQARIVNKLCRKITAAMNEVGREVGIQPTVILLNQVRQKIGVVFGDPETVPGGMMQGFLTSIEVRSWRGKVILDGDDDDDPITRTPLYQILNFRVVKNKTSPPGYESEYKVMLTDTEVHKKGDVADEETVFALALKHGVIKASDKKNKYVFGEEHLYQSEIQKRWMGDRTSFEKTKLEVMQRFRAV